MAWKVGGEQEWTKTRQREEWDKWLQTTIPGATGHELTLSNLFSELFVPGTSPLIASGKYEQKAVENISYEEWRLLHKNTLKRRIGKKEGYHLDKWGNFWHGNRPIEPGPKTEETCRVVFDVWKKQQPLGKKYTVETVVEKIPTIPPFDLQAILAGYIPPEPLTPEEATTAKELYGQAPGQTGYGGYVGGLAKAAADWQTKAQQIADDWQAFENIYFDKYTDIEEGYQSNIAGIPQLNLGLPGGGTVPLAPKAHMAAYSEQAETLNALAQIAAGITGTGIRGRQDLLDPGYRVAVDALERGLLPIDLAQGLLSNWQAERMAQPTVHDLGTKKTDTAVSRTKLEGEVGS